MRRLVIIVLAGLLLGLPAREAQAQAQTETRPRSFVIHPVFLTDDVRSARAGEPLFVQPATAPTGAELGADVRPPFLFSFGSYAAGTRMYGSGLTLLNYCANAGGSTACFAAAGDELILVADCTTAPFGFEVLVYQCGPMKVLKPAVPFKRLKAFDGPHMQFAVMFEAKQVGPGEGYRVSLYPALQSGAKWHRIGREFAVGMVRPNAPVHLVGEGVDVEVLGVDDDGVVSYRVHKTMPWQLAEIQLSVTTVTSYHVVTIYGR